MHPKLLRGIFVLLISIFEVSFGFSQNSLDDGEKPLFSPNGFIKKTIASNKFRNNNFSEAVTYYESMRDVDPENSGIYFKIGLCYFNLKAYDEAIKNFEKALKYKKDYKEEASFYLGRSYQTINNFDKAITNYNIYKRKVSSNKADAKGIDMYIGQCNFSKNMMADKSGVIVKPVSPNINSRYADYAPVVTPDGKVLIFTSRRESTTGYGKDQDDKKYFEDIYISSFDSDTKEWSKARSIGDALNITGHDANVGLSPDGNILFVYNNVHGGDIFQSTLDVNGNWSTPEPLPFGINSSSFETSASITSDKKTIYFVSERSGGMGKGDIYYSVKDENGNWGTPVNIGETVNTDEDEVSCFVSPDGNALFFSSKGHQGMGGYDIFKTVKSGGKWTRPVNMGYPINSTNDDLHFYLTKDKGWFSSAREGNNDNREIYYVDLKTLNNIDFLPTSGDKSSNETGSIAGGQGSDEANRSNNSSDKKNPSEKSGRDVDSKSGKSNKKSGIGFGGYDGDEAGGYTGNEPRKIVTKAGVKMPEKKTIVSGKVIEPSGKGISAEIIVHSEREIPHIITDEKGSFSISKEEIGLSFANVEARKTGYQAYGSQELTVNENESSNSTEMHFTLRLKEVAKDSVMNLNKALDANPKMIIFDFASSELNLNEGNKEKLNQIADEILRNKKIQVELSGHTDLVGTPLFNLQLSLNRAYAVANYLKEKGVSERKIHITGHGALVPFATNETEDGRRTNRRVEINFIK